MSDDAAARRLRRSTWTSQAYRGPRASERMAEDDADEWAAMPDIDRLALTWELSLAQYGGGDEHAISGRLPRSAYRVERR